MKNRFTFLLLTIISTAFSQQKIDTIPFQTNSKLLVFKGKINGYETNFAFDTGASVGVLNNNQANNAKVNSKKEKKVKDSNQKSAAIKITTINEITIGSFTIENTKNGIFEMPYLGCNDFFLLGGNVINELNWKIDFDKNVVYVSKEIFTPTETMLPLDIKIKDNRHFANFTLNNKEIKDCLIDFGYVGLFEISAKDKIVNQIITENNFKSINGTTFSTGLTSSTNKNTDYFLINNFKIGNHVITNLPAEIEQNTITKVGLKFFTAVASQLIINSNEKKYYFNYHNKPINKELGFDADCYFKDNKLIIVSKINNENTSAKNIEIGEEIKSVNGKTATDFKNECDFIKWMLYRPISSSLTIVKMNNETVIVNRQTL